MDINSPSLQQVVMGVQTIVVAAVTVLVARLKKRPPAFWGILALFFSVWALLLLVLLPPPDPEAEKKSVEGEQKTAPAQPEAPQAPIQEAPTYSKEQFLQADWYYVNEVKAVTGPMTAKALQELVTEKKVTLDTWVWCEYMPSWQRIKDSSQISSLFQYTQTV